MTIIAESNGNSFIRGGTGLGGGMTGPAALCGEKIIYEDMASRMNAPVASGALL